MAYSQVIVKHTIVATIISSGFASLDTIECDHAFTIAQCAVVYCVCK